MSLSLSAFERRTLWTSFAVLALSGFCGISAVWLSVGEPGPALIRGTVFVLAVALLHVAGMLIYTGQGPGRPRSAPRLHQHGWVLVECALVCMVLAVSQFVLGWNLRLAILESGRELTSVPPTLLSRNPATGFAFVCIGMCFVLAAFRRQDYS